MKEKQLFIIAAFTSIIIPLFPFLYLQADSYIMIHDNLDSEFVWLHILKMSHLLLSIKSETVVPNVMNGLPRSLFHSEFSLVRLFFCLLPSFWAYIFNGVLVRIIGFTGMYLLIKDYLIKEEKSKIIFVAALLFSLIPLYTLYGISVMGQPILFWAFMNLSRNRKKIINWLIIIFFPFYSHFALVAPFILFAISVYGIYKLIYKDQTIHFNFFIGLGLLFCCFIVANFITIHQFLFPHEFVSHRSLWRVNSNSFSFYDIITSFIEIFTKGQYHSSSFTVIPIYLLSLISLFIVKDRKIRFLLIAPLLLIGAISLFNAAYPFICYFLQNLFPVVNIFQFNRFTFLIPVLWFISLAVSIRFIKNKISPIVIYSILMLQAFFILKENEEIKYNYSKIFFHTQNMPGFKSFFASDQFSEIEAFINKPKNEYRIVSIGIHPSIAQYNGFFTLDGYQNNYPLKYKYEFREIISQELNKNENMKKYFDNWGSRCYMFNAELWNACYVRCAKNYKIQINNLSINTDAFKKMGGKYIFSAVPIANYKNLKLSFLRKFSDNESEWDIYLYVLSG